MRSISPAAQRGAALSLFCILGAMVPSAIPGHVQAPAVALAAPGPQVIKTPPTAVPTLPTDQPGSPTLLAQELAAKKAPAPSGPATVIPILLYHYIRVNPVPSDRVGFNLSTPPAAFQAQMQYLATHGFHVISLHQAVDAIRRHTVLPSRPVVLTFDDGYTDFFTNAVPAMQAYGFTGTDFVISGRMGRPGFMTAAQIQTSDQLGFTIGAHTVDHYALAGLTPARAAWEMRQSKLALEAVLGHPVIDFAYPYGSYNAFAIREAGDLGFETAVSTLTGRVHTPAQLMLLSRLRVGGAMSLATFAHLVGGPAPTPGPSPMPSPGPTPLPSATASATPSPSPRRSP